MIVTVSSRHMEVTEPLKAYAENKANKLSKYYDRIQEIERDRIPMVGENRRGEL